MERSNLIRSIILLDRQTSELRRITPMYADDHPWDKEWQEGHWSCDCNRSQLFGNLTLARVPCIGHNRYVVLAVNDIGAQWSIWNRLYPEVYEHKA